MSKKRILILVDWFAPGYKAGGPIQSCVNLCYALKNHFDLYVLTTDTDHGETTPYPGITPDVWLTDCFEGITICYLQQRHRSIFKLAEKIKEANADFVYLNHLFSPRFVVYPIWLKWLGRIDGKVLVCPRGALYDSALSVKAYKKKPLLWLYRRMGIEHKVRFHATNEREAAAIKRHFPAASIQIADNLPNVNQAPFQPVEKRTGELQCIFVSRIVPIKNLLYLLKLLSSVRGQLTLTVVGPVENEQYWQQCRQAITLLPQNIVVNTTGAVVNAALPALIRRHHLFVLPTTGENFGHAIFEAFMNGRPVLISDQTPWQQLAIEFAGWELPLSNPDRFLSIIQLVTDFGQEEYDQYANGAWKYAQHFIQKSEAITQYHHLFA